MELRFKRFVGSVWVAVTAILGLSFLSLLFRADTGSALQAVASLFGGAVSAIAAVGAVAYQFKRQDEYKIEHEKRLRRALRDELIPFAENLHSSWTQHLKIYEKKKPHFGDTINPLNLIPETWQFPPAAAQALRQFDPAFESRETKLAEIQIRYTKARNMMSSHAGLDSMYDNSPVDPQAAKAYFIFQSALSRYAVSIRQLLLDLEPDDRALNAASKLDTIFERIQNLQNEHVLAGWSSGAWSALV